ncbi:MAG: hypothetical protein AAF206_30855 [Bacteroidota bacterium]
MLHFQTNGTDNSTGQLSFADLRVELDQTAGFNLSGSLGNPEDFLQQYPNLQAVESHWARFISSKQHAGKLHAYLSLQGNADSFPRNRELVVKLQYPGNKNMFGLMYSDPDGHEEWLPPTDILSAEEMEFTLPPLHLSVPATGSSPQHTIPNTDIIRIVEWTDLAVPSQKPTAISIATRKYAIDRVVANEDGWSFQTFAEYNHQSWQLTEPNWAGLRQATDQRVLLLIHGTNGTSEVAYGPFLEDQKLMQLLSPADANHLGAGHYGNRIISFRFPSLAVGVKANGEMLGECLTFLCKTFNIKLNQLDIITRSLGALVARHMLEISGQPNGVEVKKVVMLGGPNQGTFSSMKGNGSRTAVVSMLLKKMDKRIGKIAAKSMQPEAVMAVDMDAQHEVEQEISDSIAYLKTELNGIMLSKEQGLIQPIGAKDQAINSPYVAHLNDQSVNPDDFPPLPEYFAIFSRFDACHPAVLDALGKHPKNIRLAARIADAIAKTYRKNPLQDIQTSPKGSCLVRQEDEIEPNDGINPTFGNFGGLRGSEAMLISPVSPRFHMPEENQGFVTEKTIHHINYPQSVELKQFMLKFLDISGRENYPQSIS